MNEKEFEKYASLVLQVGVNLQKGQMVFANCPAKKAELAEIFARRAFLRLLVLYIFRYVIIHHKERSEQKRQNNYQRPQRVGDKAKALIHNGRAGAHP